MDSVSNTRLFLALWPDPAVRHALRERRDLWDWPRGASPVHPDKLHVTLHFLGSVPSERVPDLRRGFAVPFIPFELTFGVPKLWHNGIAVLEPSNEPPELLELHAQLTNSLVALGLQPEARKYRPHVTFARRASGVVVPADSPPLVWKVDGYALVESHPENGGVYQVLETYS